MGELNRPSWDFVDDSHPVITAATAAERDKNDLVQRQGNLVGHDVVLNVVRDALAESLEGEAEQSAFDGNAVPGRGVSVPLIRPLVGGRQGYSAHVTDRNVHKTGAPARRIQEIVAVVNLPRFCEQRVEGYAESRLVAKVDDLMHRRDSACLGYPGTAG